MSIKLDKNLRVHSVDPRSQKWRTTIAALTIVSSVAVGILLVGASDRSIPIWGATRDLGIGATIHDGDLILRQVHLDRSASIYLSGGYQPDGLYVTRDLRAGELLPATAVAKSAGLAMRRVVTVEIDSHHLPPDIARGDLVDLYVTAHGSSGEILGAPERVIGDVVVDSIEANTSSTHFGVALSLLDVDVPSVVEAAQRGHLDLVGRR